MRRWIWACIHPILGGESTDILLNAFRRYSSLQTLFLRRYSFSLFFPCISFWFSVFRGRFCNKYVSAKNTFRRETRFGECVFAETSADTLSLKRLSSKRLESKTSDRSERTILAKTNQIVPFASPSTVFPNLLTARSTTDVATTTGLAEQVWKCVYSRDTSLVVEAFTTPEVSNRRLGGLRLSGNRTRDSTTTFAISQESSWKGNDVDTDLCFS